MIRTDRHGNDVSTRTLAALEAYDRALAQFHLYRGDPFASLDAALSEDPDFTMAHLAKASLMLTGGESVAEPGMKACLEAAQASNPSGQRERAYLEACRAWLDRDFLRSNALFGRIALESPRDLLALQVAHLQDFLLGQATMLRDRPSQTLRAWGPAEPACAFVLGMQAFGLEECGDYAAAEIAGRRAIEMQPADGWAAHAVAHVMEMQGRVDEGIEWIESTAPAWSPESFFAYHNWWHLALHALERDDAARALEIYDTRIRPGDSRVAMEMVDASALLWRLRLRGVDVGARWNALATAWQGCGEPGFYPFNDVHALMALLASGQFEAAQQLIAALERAAVGGDTSGAKMTREVGLPVARALEAFERGAYDVTIDALLRVRGIAQRFGGSHAQRDVLQLTVTEAALRSGRTALAEGLVAERLSLKASSPTNRAFLARITSLRDRSVGRLEAA